MTSREKKALIKKIEASKAKIAAERDALRELIYEAESIEFDASEAVDSLQSAVDTLSQYL